MTKRLLFLLLLLCASYPEADAQFRLPKPPKRPERHVAGHAQVRPTTQVITLETGLGGIGGYAAGSLGLEYERFIMTPQWISATCRLGAYVGGTINLGGELERGEVFSQNRGGFIAPGMRFHPLRNRTHADLGLGVCFPLGIDVRRDMAPGTINTAGTTSGFLGACMGELSVNLRRSAPHRSVFGFFGAIGYCYSNDPAVTYTYPDGRFAPSHSEDDPLLVQIGLRFGAGW